MNNMSEDLNLENLAASVSFARDAEYCAELHLKTHNPDWYNIREAKDAIADASRYWIYALADLCDLIRY